MAWLWRCQRTSRKVSQKILTNIIDQKSIQLLAKQVAVFQATFQAFKESQEEGVSDAKVNIGGTSKQL